MAILTPGIESVWMENRGRFQAQGRKLARGQELEESESWAQTEPLYLDQGNALLMNLQEKIPPFERNKRKKAFAECKKFIERASRNGGIEIIDRPVRKSFLRNETERVDLEVLKGKAFLMRDEDTQ